MRAVQHQISAYISEETKERLERYVASHGLKKGHVIEMALLYHLQALEEVPVDLVIPPRIVLSEKGFEAVVREVESEDGPTETMKALFEKGNL